MSFDEVMAINLTAVMDSCRLAEPKIATGGSIINIASMYSAFGAADRPAYAASKGATVQLTKSLAIEYAKKGIRVNAVALGWIITSLSAELFANAKVADPILARIPAGRWGDAVDVADAINSLPVMPPAILRAYYYQLMVVFSRHERCLKS